MTDPLDALACAFNLKWEGSDLHNVSADVRATYDRDLRYLQYGEAFMKHVTTQWGNFTSEMISEVRQTLEQADRDGMERDQTVMWRGQELVISFGWYLVEFVEAELAKANTGGL